MKVGDGVSYCIGSDTYPMTVRKVSPSGMYVWASNDTVRRGATGKVFIPGDPPESDWEKFARGKNGRYRPVGRRSGYLSEGRAFYMDPCF